MRLKDAYKRKRRGRSDYILNCSLGFGFSGTQETESPSPCLFSQETESPFPVGEACLLLTIQQVAKRS